MGITIYWARNMLGGKSNCEVKCMAYSFSLISIIAVANHEFEYVFVTSDSDKLCSPLDNVDVLLEINNSMLD